MGADQNPVQGAEVFGVAVVSALRDGAFDALVGVAVHNELPPLFGNGDSITKKSGIMTEKKKTK